jgi:hypothetical protein
LFAAIACLSTIVPFQIEFVNFELHIILLQNNAHDDQFKPWVDDSKDQEVIPVMD